MWRLIAISPVDTISFPVRSWYSPILVQKTRVSKVLSEASLFPFRYFLPGMMSAIGMECVYKPPPSGPAGFSYESEPEVFVGWLPRGCWLEDGCLPRRCRRGSRIWSRVGAQLPRLKLADVIAKRAICGGGPGCLPMGVSVWGVSAWSCVCLGVATVCLKG